MTQLTETHVAKHTYFIVRFNYLNTFALRSDIDDFLFSFLYDHHPQSTWSIYASKIHVWVCPVDTNSNCSHTNLSNRKDRRQPQPIDSQIYFNFSAIFAVAVVPSHKIRFCWLLAKLNKLGEQRAITTIFVSPDRIWSNSHRKQKP